MQLVDAGDWLGKAHLPDDIAKRIILWERDIQSCQISIHDYKLAKERMTPDKPSDAHVKEIPILIHYASNFVCAMRRVGRGLESMSKERAKFAEPVGKIIKQVWRKKKAMFDTYTSPRNAIEHLDDEISSEARWTMFNLHNDRLLVTKEKAADISEKNLDSVLVARDEIVRAILEYMLIEINEQGTG